MRKIHLILLLCLTVGGCAAVPTQLKDAITVQEREIKNVRELYVNNVNNLLDSIEKYRMEIINIYEQEYIAQYSKSFDVKTDAQGNPQPQEVQPTGDPDVDHIHLSTLKKIREFFDNQRQQVSKDISERRKQYNLIHENFENIETVNAAISDYIDSLSRLKNARDSVTQSLANKIGGIVPIPINLANLPDPSTIEDIVKAFTP